MASDEIIRWLEETVIPLAGSQAAVGRAIARATRQEEDRSKINKVLKGKRDLSIEELVAIEAAYKVTAPRPGVVSLAVPLISWVSAGNLMTPDGSLDFDDAPRVTGPDLDPTGDWIALKVVGDSMDLISPPDSIIFVNRRDKKLVPNACYVVRDENGSATYKRYRDGKYSPVSANKAHKDLKTPAGQAVTILGRVRKSILAM